MRTLRIYYDTVRYLKFRQLFFGVFYRLKKPFLKTSFKKAAQNKVDFFHLNLNPSIHQRQSFSQHKFSFLNLSKSFDGDIDWNYLGYGKLWSYNLNYFDYLNQKVIDLHEATSILESFCSEPDERKEGNEPYPISLRGINWIKFFSSRNVSNSRYNQLLFAHYKYLSSNLEYHLLGNHLLENGFSLLFGAYYFQNDNFYKKATTILISELEEQILDDGGHFELSPMYHQILLFRLLDVINVVKNNSWKNQEHLAFFNKKAQAMLGWLNEITFSNGEVPMVNDSAYNIGPSSLALMDYANRLGILPSKRPLSSSGYRMIQAHRMELFVDVGNIGADYIPGHAHSDTLNFILYADQKPIVVDTATSTYERDGFRQFERSTQSHNTVAINNVNQSEVWASFRVGRRARITDLEESENYIKAAHNGYKSLGLKHTRHWRWENDKILIVDEVSGTRQVKETMAYFHFHPNVDPLLEGTIVNAGGIRFKWTGSSQIRIQDYDFAAGFNNRVKSKVAIVKFIDHLETRITFLSDPSI